MAERQQQQNTMKAIAKIQVWKKKPAGILQQKKWTQSQTSLLVGVKPMAHTGSYCVCVSVHTN
jgi:hypothetical protein